MSVTGSGEPGGASRLAVDPTMHRAGAPIGIVGAGAMGSGIAQVAAQAGHPVYLVDAVPGAAEAAIERARGTLDRLAAKGIVAAEEAAATGSRMRPVGGVADLPECALVIEAIHEDLSDKRALFEQLTRTQPASTILATNTSSLDVSAIAAGLPDPGRIIGLHFFNPPARMRLVEVIRGRSSDPAALDRAARLVTSWGKTCVRCASTPGFIVNRVARPFYGEAQRMVQEGIADPATIDYALRAAGFPMGPMELTDLIGQDVNYAVGVSVWEQTGRDPRYAPTAYQRTLVEAGRLGRKSGRGVFRYEGDTAVDAIPDEAAAARLADGPVRTDPVARTLAMLVNEAVDLVARGEAGAGDVDIAMRLGTNYPRGPVEWGRQIGFARVAEQLAELDAAYPGGRYRPSPALLSLPEE